MGISGCFYKGLASKLGPPLSHSRSAHVFPGVPAPAAAQFLQGQGSEPDLVLQPKKQPCGCPGKPQPWMLPLVPPQGCPESLSHTAALGGAGCYRLAWTPVLQGDRLPTTALSPTGTCSVPFHSTAPSITPRLGHSFLPNGADVTAVSITTLTAASGSIQLCFCWVLGCCCKELVPP